MCIVDVCLLYIRVLVAKLQCFGSYNLLMLTSFEVATVTTMDSQEPACCVDGGFLTK